MIARDLLGCQVQVEIALDLACRVGRIVPGDVGVIPLSAETDTVPHVAVVLVLVKFGGALHHCAFHAQPFAKQLERLGIAVADRAAVHQRTIGAVAVFALSIICAVLGDVVVEKQLDVVVVGFLWRFGDRLFDSCLQRFSVLLERVAALGKMQLHVDGGFFLIVAVAGAEVDPEHLGMVAAKRRKRHINIVPVGICQTEPRAVRLHGVLLDHVVRPALGIQRQLVAQQLGFDALPFGERHLLQRHLFLVEHRLLRKHIFSLKGAKSKYARHGGQRQHDGCKQHLVVYSHTITCYNQSYPIIILYFFANVNCLFKKTVICC